MAITTLGANDSGSTSRTVINDNFSQCATLASPALTGNPTAPTQTAGDNSTKIATTAYVNTAITQISTSGVSAGPASSSTQTITHGLGKTPSVIRITGYGLLQGSTQSQSYGSTTGTYTSSGNRCAYAVSALFGVDGSIGTSSTFAVYLSGLTPNESTEVHASGVIQNLTLTTFDIAWTASADTSTATVFVWEVN